MPTAITTSDAGMIRPSSSSTPSTLPLPMMALVLALQITLMPRSSTALCNR
jgi:hypothetical protein